LPSLRQNEQLLPRERQDESVTLRGVRAPVETDLLPLAKWSVNVLLQWPPLHNISNMKQNHE
jgi:hypothetical protein